MMVQGSACDHFVVASKIAVDAVHRFTLASFDVSSEEREDLRLAPEDDRAVIEAGELPVLDRGVQRLQLLAEGSRARHQRILVADADQHRQPQDLRIGIRLHAEERRREQGDAGPDLGIFLGQVPRAAAALRMTH